MTVSQRNAGRGSATSVDYPSAAFLGAFEHSLRRFKPPQSVPTALQDDVAHRLALALRLQGDRPVQLARHLHLNGPVAENSRHRRHSALDLRSLVLFFSGCLDGEKLWLERS